jgi:hypothetical protein
MRYYYIHISRAYPKMFFLPGSIGGRQISSLEFAHLQKEIAGLNDELDLVELDDDEEI